MKTRMNWKLQAIVVLCSVVLSTAEDEYEEKLSKLWSVNGVANSDGVINVKGPAVIQPQPNSEKVPRSRKDAVEFQRYAFRPRAIPLRTEPPSKVENNVYYSPDNLRYPKALFPGNYYRIAKEKSESAPESESPVETEQFHPKAIPPIRGQERSLDSASEPIIEKPEDFAEQTASRRSISYIFGDLEDEEEDRDDDIEEAEEDEEKEGFKSKIKKPKVKSGKLKKYVLPLLLAYKMKYFALVPVLIGGLILLIGSAGLAGFFFALFAAVMGLQKGGY